MIECSICGQQFNSVCNNNTEEIILKSRKVSHENYHMIKAGKQRHSDQLVKRNMKLGKVTWKNV